MRKLFSLFVALFSTSALWAYDFQSGDLYYNITSSSAPYTVKITYQEYSSSNNYYGLTTAAIPETVTYNGTTYSVTSIGSSAFYGCSSLTSITIPNSVTSIGSSAFYGCSSLTSITIPNSVTSIGYDAFYNTGIYNDKSNWKNDMLYISNCLIEANTSISGACAIEENTRLIAGFAFSYRTNLTSVFIPNSVTSIGECAFEACTNLTSVTIPNRIMTIREKAFVACSSLTSITIPNSVTSIGDLAFSECTSLTSIVIPDSVTSIGECAFQYCSKLTSITIPNSVTSIGNGAFASCSSLTSIVVESGNTTYDSRENCNAIVETATNTLIVGCQNTIIPNSVTSIGSSAFLGCSKLTSLTIPNSVTSIGNGAFASCSFLTSIVVESGNTTYDSRENCNAIIETATNTLIAGCQNTIIPNSVTSIGSRAFYGCSSLTSITIPNSVKSIGDGAFGYCGLISVACLATTPPTMSNYVFESSRLPSIYIPDNTLSIYQTAWGTNYVYVNNETTLTIHVDVSGTLSNKIVQSGKHLDEIARLTVTGTLNDDDFTYMRASMKSLVDINLSAITNTSGVNFNTKSNLLKIVLPNNLKAIEQTAFFGCCSLTSITIPNSVTSIGEDAFFHCTSLTSVTIPSSVKSIGDSTFKNCSSLSSVTIGNNVTSIGGCAFEACSQLTSVTIPNSVTNIGERIFKNCSSLSSVTIGNNVTSIGDRVFYGCTSLTSITIPNSVTSIGEWTFAYCSSLASVTIGTNVTAIGSCAFYSCDALTSITWNPKHYADFSYSSHTPFDKPEQISSFTFGDAVEHIPAYLCSGMIKLTSITIPNSVTSIGAYAFAYSEALTSITIPNSVKSIGRDAFQGVESLNKTICSGDIASWCNIEFDGMFANPITYSHNLYINDQEVKSLVIPNSVTSIGNCAFYNCRSLTSIIIPNSVTSIGDYAFSGCIFTYDKFINNSSLNAKTNNYWSAIIVDSEIDGLLIRNDTLIACRPHVTSAIIPNSVTSIGDLAFKGCSRLTSITIPNSVKSIGSSAFYGCSSLDTVTCLAMTPPALGGNVFNGCDNPTLFVPCGALSDYQAHEQWGQITNVQCISSEEAETEEVVIESGTTTITITWPTEEGADTYTIVIKKDGEVVCTLTFNSEGQLLNIAFAPSRDGENHPAQYAEQAGKGYRFTVTGLEQSTQYTYNITAKDAANKTINSHSGKFTTKALTAVDNINAGENSKCQKLFRNGQLIIVRDGVEYNAMGQEM